MTSEPDDAPPRRRRGERLTGAIYQACLDELRERGYASLTMDSVAARAQTGKATLYRRWPNKAELIAAALHHTVPRFAPPPDSGETRGELIAVLRSMSDHLTGPLGAAARALVAAGPSRPRLGEILREQFVGPAVPPTLEVLRRAAGRGEAPAAALTPRVAGVGGELLRGHVMLHQAPVPDAVLAEIVDQVLLPLLRGLARPADAAPADQR